MMGATSPPSSSGISDLRSVLALAERLSQLDRVTLDADLAALAKQHEELLAQRQCIEALQRTGATQIAALQEATQQSDAAARGADEQRRHAEAALSALSAERDRLDLANQTLAADEAALAGAVRGLASAAENHAAEHAAGLQALAAEKAELVAVRQMLADRLAAADDTRLDYETKLAALRTALGG